jgi:serine phosphatase RsbU (regulator of sigma subunit)
MKKILPVTYLLGFVLSFPLVSQNMDSLWKIYRNTKNPDSIRFEAFNDIAWEMLYVNPDSSYLLGKEELDMARAKKLKNWEIKSLNTIGASFHVRGDYGKAVEYYQQSLRISENINDKKGIAASLGNIGGIYLLLDKYDKALDYELRAQKLLGELGNKEGLASTYNNLGLIYNAKDDYEKALEYNNSSLALYRDLGDKHGMSASYGNIGELYMNLKDTPKAIEFYLKSLAISEEIEDQQARGKTKASIATAYAQQKKFPLAIEYAKSAEKIAEEAEDLSTQRSALRLLYGIHKELKQTDKALEYYEQFTFVQDSIHRADKQREIEQKEMQYEFDKKMSADSVKNAESQKVKDALILAKNAEIEQDKTQKIALTGGLLLFFVSGGIMYTRFRIIRKQKEIIEEKSRETEEQKLIIEEKQTEILSSISYAKRLQEAILPPQGLLTEYLPHSFIIYEPKDIVAGDFYWLEHIGDLVLIAAADCTGHGVPGAMVSVVCSNALNRAVKEFEISDPGKILDKTRELVTETFERSENEVKDGMDISLCSLNRKTKELKWAGANNPLWIICDSKFTEIKPNKQPIGKVDNPAPFKTHTLSLKSSDLVYIFTDGYADQFGGPDGKKFKYKQFNELTCNNHLLPLNEQKEMMLKTFYEWKGDLEQVDDVCIIGIKI